MSPAERPGLRGLAGRPGHADCRGAASATHGSSALAPSFRPEPRNPQQGLGLAEERHAEIYPRDEYIGRAEFCRDAVCLPVLRVVERAAVPVVEASGLQPLKNGQAAQRALSGCRFRVLVVADQPPRRVPRRPQPYDPAAELAAAIEDLDG